MFGKDLHDPGEGARPVEGALWAARDFDPVDGVRGQIGKIKLAGQSLIDRNAIEKHLHVLARQPAHENRGQLPRRAGLDNGQARDFPQSVCHPLNLLPFKIRRIEHAHAGGRLIEREVEPRGRDHDGRCFIFRRRVRRRGCGGVSVLGPQGPCGSK